MRKLLLIAAVAGFAAPAAAQVLNEGPTFYDPETTGSIEPAMPYERDPRINNEPFVTTNPAAAGNAEGQNKPTQSYGGVAGGPANRF